MRLLHYAKVLFLTVIAVAFAQDAFAGKIMLTGHTDYRDGAGGEFNVRAYDTGGFALLDGALSDAYLTANGTTPGTVAPQARLIG